MERYSWIISWKRRLFWNCRQIDQGLIVGSQSLSENFQMMKLKSTMLYFGLDLPLEDEDDPW
jgi:hypothetical protein